MYIQTFNILDFTGSSLVWSWSFHPFFALWTVFVLVVYDRLADGDLVGLTLQRQKRHLTSERESMQA